MPMGSSIVGGHQEAAGAVQFKILGPLEVLDGQRLVELGRPKQRALLAVLLVHANQVVALDRLIEELWGEQPPAQATASLQTYVSNLRRVLEPDRPTRTPPRVLVTQPPGSVPAPVGWALHWLCWSDERFQRLDRCVGTRSARGQQGSQRPAFRRFG